MRRVIATAGVSLLCATALACGPDEHGETPPSTTAPPAEAPPLAESGEPSVAEPEPAVEPTVEPSVETAPATLCDRARLCCTAFVAAIPSSRRPLEERACEEMDRLLAEAGEQTEEACEAAIGGWRQSLQLTGIEVPAACAE